MARKIIDRRLKTFSKMPPLYHTLPNADFDISKSEILKWLTKQPEILNYLKELAIRKELISYNKQTGKWQGVGWEGNENDY